jgi:hypothetical protein
MRLLLHHLCSMHPKLRTDPADLSRFGALAMQRAGHKCPARAAVIHDGLETAAAIEWLADDTGILGVLDSHRVTEDGAEAVALTYVNASAGWVVERRMLRFESADWLMQSGVGSMALEVSGTASGDPLARLKEKKEQVARCTLPVDRRLAVVVAFEGPSIFAGSV